MACGDGECIDRNFFCDGKPDCKDASDENACGTFTRERLSRSAPHTQPLNTTTTSFTRWIDDPYTKPH